MNIFKHSKKLNQSGFDHILVVVSCMVVIAVVGTYVLISNSHAAATSQAELKSGISGTYCLDDNADGGTNAIVDTWGCNGTPAQKFSYSGNLLHIGTNGCAREAGSSATTGQGKGAKWAGSVVIGSCSGPPYGAVWERVGSTFENAHAGSKGGTYCLDVSAFKAKTQLDIYQCNGGANQSWTNYTWTSGGGSGGGGGGGTTSGSYENPLRSVSGLTPERIDQGVDYAGSGPVYAIGPGTIESTNNSGWPDGNFVSYRLTASNVNKYNINVYVAEDCNPTVRVGATVSDTTEICSMFNGGSGIETGFAAPSGLGESLERYYDNNCFNDDSSSTSTYFGEAFNQVLELLGARGGITHDPLICSIPSSANLSNIESLL